MTEASVGADAVALRSPRAAGAHTLPIRGRTDELGVVDEVIAALRDGPGSLLLIHGPPGIGKSRVLSETRTRAEAMGVRPLFGKAFEEQQMVPFAPLLTAFLGADPPIGDPKVFRALGASADLRYWLVHDLQMAVAATARDTPLMVIIDDAHWTDTVSLMALSSIMSELAAAPIAWVLALRSAGVRPAVRDSVGAMIRAWGSRVRQIHLKAVGVGAAAEIAKDVLRADLDTTLLELMTMAHGNPFLLLELLRGLSEEDRIHISRGRASAVGEAIPRRLTDTMDQRLDRLSPAARQVVQVASVLPERFSAIFLARMVKRHPASLIEFVGEAVKADLLTEGDDMLKFRHDLLRHAARDSIPTTLRRAMERESANVLLDAGAAPEEVATLIARSAEVGDRRAVTTLRLAAESLSRTDPSGAADLSCRAGELTSVDDPQRFAVVAESARLLNRAQRYAEATQLVTATLALDLPADEEAQIRLSMSMLSEHGPGHRALENVRSLQLDGIEPRTRARHLGWLAYNAMMDGQTDVVRSAALNARKAAADASDPRVEVIAGLALANAECAEGFAASGLDTLAEVRHRLCGNDFSDVEPMASFHFANIALTLGRLDEAADAISRGIDDARRSADTVVLHGFVELDALRAVAEGKMSDARASLETLPGGFGFIDPGASGVIHAMVLTEVAARTEDRNLLRIAGIAAQYLTECGPAGRRASLAALAVAAWANDDVDRAAHLLTEIGELTGTPLFALDLDRVVLAARVAAASGSNVLRGRVESAIAAMKRDGPEIPMFAAVAAHASGLLRGDVEDLMEAVGLLSECQRPVLYAAAAEDCGLLLARAGDLAAALPMVNSAFDGYTQCECSFDAHRVRRALHSLGVARRVGRRRIRTGWDSLTKTEWRVVELVADGATNRQVAEQLWQSQHTVSTHLRNVYAKLGIRSRGQLTRMVRGDQIRNGSGAELNSVFSGVPRRDTGGGLPRSG